MKKRFLALTLFLSILMIMSGVSGAFATVDDGNAYGYTIKVYAGEHGHFTGSDLGEISDGGKTLTIKTDPGDSLTITESTTGFKLDNKTYYVRGFRKAGHDNDELVATFPSVDADASYEVAYGIAGGMVKYTLRYLDKDGNELRDSDEYYGMVGDKPVVSYKYIEGYQPNAYNLKKTLVKDESNNVFEFEYTANPGADGTGTGNGNGTNGNNGNANGANGNGTNGAVNADGADLTAGGNTGPAEIIDLDDGDTPLAGGSDDGADLADSETPKSGVSPAAIGGGVAVLAAIAAAAAVIARRRNAYADDDDEEEE